MGRPRRYRITVDQAAIEADQPALHVHDTDTGVRQNYTGRLLLQGATLTQGPTQQDGARVWIDCDSLTEWPDGSR